MENYTNPLKECVEAFLLNLSMQFLEVNNLKEGDIVQARFEYYEFDGTPRHSHKIGSGVIKKTRQGYVYIESIEYMNFYSERRVGKRVDYVTTPKKSICLLLDDTYNQLSSFSIGAFLKKQII